MPVQPSISQLVLADGKTVAIVLGDLCDEQTDAIVNAANSALAAGAGVDGAIRRRAGRLITEECNEIIRRQGRVAPGEAVITGAGELPARFVIHTVGPVWRGGRHDEAAVLAGAYRACIALGDERRLSSVSFPAISTGAFGYPLQPATEIALRASVHALKLATQVRDIHFVLFDPETFALYVKTARALANELGARAQSYTVPAV